MRGTIDYAGGTISYRARHSARKTLAISVNPDGAVEIVAPDGTGQQVIEQRLLRRASWVLHQCRYFEQFRPRTPARRYVGGETHLYLGRQYRLKIQSDEVDSVRLRGGFIVVTLGGDTNRDRVRSHLQEWYCDRGRAKLAERFEAVTTRFARLARDKPTLAVRPMLRRWGSYSAKGRITLNVDLIRAPLPCIDYVIVHELAHARHPHHGRAFFDLLSEIMPDWEKRKLLLERMLA